jgi:hypothetical protein
MHRERTPAAHREIVAEIMGDMAANDSAIIPRPPRSSATPRHRRHADELRPLLEWRRLADPVPEFPTSWCAPANNNDPADTAGNVEAEWEIRPTIGELTRAHKKYGPGALRLRDGKLEIKGGKYWVAAKDEPGTPYGVSWEEREDRATAIAALKYLLGYISGEPIEPAEPRDQHFSPRGVGHVETPAQAALRSLLADAGVGASTPFDEARRRWDLSPVANDNRRPVFPREPADPRELFQGFKVRANPSRRDERISNIFEWVSHEQERAHLRGKLLPDTVKALDAAIEAENFEDVGRAFGHDGKTAERKGKQIVLAACAELAAVLARRDRLADS